MRLSALLTPIELPAIDTGPFDFGPDGRPGAPALSFVEFVSQVNPRFVRYPHVEKLAAVLQKVADGELSRLMVFMPPRHGKSELISRLFAAYYLYRYPARWVGITSYAAELAYTLSRNARENYTRAGGGLHPSAYAVRHWETGQGGGLWAAGVGGPITGKGFHCGIIDDPVKNAEEAHSETLRLKQWEWWQSTFLTREEPGAAIVVVQTRWHEDDLSGRILAHEEEEPENWHIVHYEAIKEAERPAYPASCALEPDFRRPGEALAPARYPLEKLERIRRRVGDYFFGALYQQQPRVRDGGMFRREWFEVVTAVPAGQVSYCRYWDKAGTRDAGSHTAGVLMAVCAGVYYVVDVVMGQWEAPAREKVITQTLESDRARYGHVPTGVEQEPGSGGKESAQATVANNPGFTVFMDRPTGEKALRAEPLAAQAAAQNVRLVAGAWNARFLEILTGFPHGITDPIDAASGAFARLASRGATWEAIAQLGNIEGYESVWT